MATFVYFAKIRLISESSIILVLYSVEIIDANKWERFFGSEGNSR